MATCDTLDAKFFQNCSPINFSKSGYIWLVLYFNIKDPKFSKVKIGVGIFCPPRPNRVKANSLPCCLYFSVIGFTFHLINWVHYNNWLSLLWIASPGLAQATTRVADIPFHVPFFFCTYSLPCFKLSTTKYTCTYCEL